MSLLERPVYTYREVDRLLGLNPDTAKRWINGYRRNGRDYDPIVRDEPTDARWVTGGEFIETRLLSEYRDVNEIKIIRMRRVVTALRDYYHRRYPLAYSVAGWYDLSEDQVQQAVHFTVTHNLAS